MREAHCLHLLSEVRGRGPHESEGPERPGWGLRRVVKPYSVVNGKKKKKGQNVKRLLSREDLADVIVIHL